MGSGVSENETNTSVTELDEFWMEAALKLAAKAELIGEVPVGAVVIDHSSNQLIGEGFNQAVSSNDASAHAEIVALRQACTAQNNYRLAHTTLYVSLEPCAMCAGAIVHSRVERVVIAAPETRAGAGGSVFNLLNNPNLNHRCEVCFGPGESQSAALLKDFFKQRR